MSEPTQQPSPPAPPRPPITQRRGGIWTILALFMVGGMLFVWWNQQQRESTQDTETRQRQAPRHLLVISIDTLRADHMGSYGYDQPTSPGLDALAAEGVLFERHYTSYPLTLPAHLTMLSGVSPLGHRARDNLYHRLPDEHTTLAEVFSEQGFRTGAFISAHTMRAGSGIERGFDVYDDDDVRELQPGRLTITERRAPGTLERAEQWVRSIGGERFFMFIHLFDPHAPYVHHHGITEEFGDDDVARYNGEIAYTDQQLSYFFNVLREIGAFDDTLIVITSDHGEGLGDHGELTHGYYCYDPTTRVPLIMRGVPGIKQGTRVPGIVRNYDLAPTLLEIMDVPSTSLGKQAHGVSLMPMLKDPEKDMGLTAYMESHYAYLNTQWAKLRALRTRDGLAVFSGPDAHYFLDNDLDTDVAEDHSEAIVEARAEITRLMNSWLPPRQGQDDALREAEAGSPYPGETPIAQDFNPENLNDTNDLPSPHAMKHVLRAYQTAELAYGDEKFESAAAMLRELLGDYPDFVLGHRLLAASNQSLMIERARRADRESLHALGREAISSLRVAITHAMAHDQPESALANARSLMLIALWIHDDQAQADMLEMFDDASLQWLGILGEYRRAATGARAEVAERAAGVRDRADLSTRAAQEADAHLAVMRAGDRLVLAPWEG
jgi:arylsulfatase A-like enzyme